MKTAVGVMCVTFFLHFYTPVDGNSRLSDACSVCSCRSDLSGLTIVNCSSCGLPRNIPKGTSYLDLSSNGLLTITQANVKSWQGIHVVDLTGNPLICGCQLALSVSQLTSSGGTILKGHCTSPKKRDLLEVNKLDPMRMQCYSSVTRHRVKRSNVIPKCTPSSPNCYYLICNGVTYWLPMTTDWGCCYGKIHDLTSSYCLAHDGVTTCSGGSFRCNNQHCLPTHWLCNGDNDCQDGSDELRCGQCTEALKSFRCKNSQCVDKNRVCDTYNDCGDGSDEAFCRKSFLIGWCGINGFRCANEKCVYIKNVCDGKDDCTDGSDEHGCLQNSSRRCPLEWSPFQDSCFKVFSSKLSWNRAQATCVANNGHLTKIISKAEEQFLQAFTRPQAGASSFWFGLRKKSREFHWTTNTVLTGNYHPWGASEPSTAGACVMFVNGTMKWRVDNCSAKKPFICSRGVTCTFPCQNGGTCGPAGCICVSPWAGDDCSYVIPVINSTSAFQYMKVKYDTPLSLSCQSSGIPRPLIGWLLNEQPLEDQHGVNISKAAFVTNLTINVRETVELRCISTNRGGMDTVKLRIVVQDDNVTSVKTTIRLTGVQYNDSLKDPLSSYTQSLAKTVTHGLSSVYRNSSGFKGLSILQFRPGSVILDLLFQFTRENQDDLTNFLRHTIKSGYLANLAVDSEYFRAEKITTVCPGEFFNVTWPVTLPSSTRQQGCPFGANGVARRTCNEQGMWLYPDYRECVSKEIMNLHKRMSAVLTKTVPSPNEVQDIISDLVEKSALPKTASKMAGDIKVSTLILTEIVTYNRKLSHDVANSTTDIQNFLVVASNLLAGQNNQEMKLLQQEDNTTTVLISALDDFSFQAARGLEATKSHTKQFVASNIVMGISLFLNTSNIGIRFPDYNTSHLTSVPEWNSIARSSIVLPKSSFDHSKESANQVKRVSSFLYRTLSSFLDIESAYDEVGGGLLLSSNIISASVKPAASFKGPVITIHNNVKNENGTPVCVFWDFELNSHGGGWSRDGCHLSSRDGVRVTCECDHLTNFAVLMRTFDLKEHELPLRIITFIGCGLSLLGLIITILVHGLFWRNLKSEKTIIHVNLCVALVAANVILLSGLDRTSHKIICKTVAVLLHYFFLSAVAWMLVEGIQMYVAIVMVFQMERKRKYFYMIGWGSPLLPVGIAMAVTQMDGYGDGRACWLSTDRGLIYAFIGPVLAVVLINIVIFVMVVRAMLTTHKMLSANEKQKARLAAKCCAVLLPLLGLTWVFGVLAVDHNVVVFLYLFAVLNSLQGFFIFVFHCLLDQQVRTAVSTWITRRKRTESAVGLRGLSSSNQSNNTNSAKDNINLYTASTTPDNATNRVLLPSKGRSDKYKPSSPSST